MCLVSSRMPANYLCPMALQTYTARPLSGWPSFPGRSLAPQSPLLAVRILATTQYHGIELRNTVGQNDPGINLTDHQVGRQCVELVLES